MVSEVSLNIAEVAVIVLNYNTPQLTVDCVNNIINYHCKVKIVLVDNASTDDSLSIFERTFAKESCVHIIHNEKNIGYAKGNNSGIRWISKNCENIKYVCIMNPDVKVDLDSFKKILECLSDGAIGFVTGRTIYCSAINKYNECAWTKPGLWKWLIGVTLFGAFLSKIKFLDGIYKKNIFGYYPEKYYCNDIAYVFAVQGCFFMGRKDVFERIGNFDENTFLYYEEEILATKVEDIGLRNAVVCNAWIRHDHKQKKKSLNKYKIRIFHIKCELDSRRYFLGRYCHYNLLVKYCLCVIWDINFAVKKLIIRLLFK